MSSRPSKNQTIDMAVRPGLVASGTSVGHHSLRWHARRQRLGSPSRQASPGARPSGQWPELALTTVLTTTTPDFLPRQPTSKIVRCQVSHVVPQLARSLQAGSTLGQGCRSRQILSSRPGWSACRASGRAS